MMETAVLYEGLRTLLLIAGPLALVVAVAGLLISALQASTTVQDPASAFAVRAAAFCAALLFLAPAFARMLIGLAQAAFR